MNTSTIMNEEILSQLAEVNTEEEFFQIMADHGVAPEEAAAFVAQLQTTSGELSDDMLDTVAGGAVPIHQFICRIVYRVQNKKLFVKSTVDTSRRTITVSSRDGKTAPQVYYY